MSKDKAFPQTSAGYLVEGGLSKREYFAAMALQGIVSNRHAWSEEIIVKQAVNYADLLIEQLGSEL